MSGKYHFITDGYLKWRTSSVVFFHIPPLPDIKGLEAFKQNQLRADQVFADRGSPCRDLSLG